jgi:hypothetical protein
LPQLNITAVELRGELFAASCGVGEIVKAPAGGLFALAAALPRRVRD